MKLILYLVLHRGIYFLLRVMFLEDLDHLSKFNICERHRGRPLGRVRQVVVIFGTCVFVKNELFVIAGPFQP